MLFTLLFPIANYALVMEVLYNLLHRKISHFNITFSSFLIGFIIICVQGANFEPYEYTCTTKKVIPSAMIASSASSTIVYWFRFFKTKRDTVFTLLWTFALITRFTSMPILKYFQWIVAVYSLIPGIIFGIAFSCFELFFMDWLSPLYSMLGLKNDFRNLELKKDIAVDNSVTITH